MQSVPTFSAPDAIGPREVASHGWARLVHWFTEARSHRVICLIACIWLLNAFDLALTILAHKQGMLQEGNPLAREFLQQGPLTLTLYKVGLVLIGSYPLVRFRRARITELGTLAVLIAYATLAVHWSTCYELYTLSASDGFSIAEVNQITGSATQ